MMIPRVKEFLRKLPKYLKTLAFIALLGYVGYCVYMSVMFRPKEVRVTNITSSSATVSWITEASMKGRVFYSEKDSFLPFFLVGLNSEKAYDDRDWSDAQTECVEKLNERAEKEVDSEFTISGDTYNCDSYRVSKSGKYYTHHITLKGLNPESSYYFRVGDGIWGWKQELDQVNTFSVAKSVKEPVPVFGKIYGEGDGYSNDSIIYARFHSNKSDVYSQTYSSITNVEGGWYLDGSYVSTDEGEELVVEDGNDTFIARARYKNRDISELYEWVFGSVEENYPDINVGEAQVNSLGSKFVLGVSAKRPDDDPWWSDPEPAADPEPEPEPEDEDDNDGGEDKKPKGDDCSYENMTACDESTLRSKISDWGAGNVVKAISYKTGQTVVEVAGGIWGADTAIHNSNAILPSDLRAFEDDVLDNKDHLNYIYDPSIGWVEAGGGTAAVTKDPASESEKGSDIPVTIGADGTWTMDFGGQVVTSEDGFTNIIDRDDPAVKAEIEKCEKTTKGCVFNLKAFQVNIIRLATEKPVIKSCIEDGKCKVAGLENAVKTQIERLGVYIENSKNTVEELKKWLESLEASVDLIPDGGLVKNEDGTYSYTGDLTNDVVLKITTGDRKGIAEDLLGVDALQGVNSATVFISISGNQLKIVYEDRITEEKITKYVDTPSKVTLSEQSYKNIGKLQEDQSSQVNKSEDGLVEVTDYDSKFVETFGRTASIEDKARLAIQLGASDADLENVDFIVFTQKGNKITVKYYDPAKYEYVEYTKTKPKVIEMTPTSYETVSGKKAPVIFENPTVEAKSTDPQVSYLGDVNPADYNLSAKHTKVYSGCFFGKECTREQAQGLLDVLNGESTGEVFVLVVDASNSDKATVKVASTVDNMEANLKELEKDLSNLEELNTKLEKTTDSFLRKLLSREVFAQTTPKEGFTFYLPEYGLFSLQLGNYEFEKEVSDGITFYVFYLETNGKDGFQIPKDPDNPTIYEDIIVRSESFQINYEKKANVTRYEVKPGVNIVSFDSIPVSTDNGTYSARDIFDNARRNGTRIDFISFFDGGRWVEGIRCETDTCSGNDFSILPGRGYLIKTSDRGYFDISVYKLKSSIPINFSAGWNLIGVHGYSQAYTAKSLITSVNEIEGLTADNVSWYPTSKGRYEGLQVSDGVEYGLDFAIDPQVGYFVRVNDYSPSDEKCRSIIWHDGGVLNGDCGDYKSILGN